MLRIAGQGDGMHDCMPQRGMGWHSRLHGKEFTPKGKRGWVSRGGRTTSLPPLGKEDQAALRQIATVTVGRNEDKGPWTPTTSGQQGAPIPDQRSPYLHSASATSSPNMSMSPLPAAFPGTPNFAITIWFAVLEALRLHSHSAASTLVSRTGCLACSGCCVAGQASGGCVECWTCEMVARV